jgi:acyl carrier protein/D-alanine--poly(phosphoribitol) ligase subunit 2
MENREQVEQQLIDFVKREFLEEEDEDMEVDGKTPLISSGVVDSFSMVSLKTFVEKNFGVQIPDAKATPEVFDTVDKIIALLDEIKG